MSSFKSTLLSYHEYLDDGLFSEMVMPEGIDTDLLVNVILKECGEMQPVWTNPIFMRKMIGLWSQQYERTFDKWLVAYNAEYNPIHNYDRHEELDETAQDQRYRTGTLNGEDHVQSDRKNTGGFTDTNTKSAYNANDYQPHDKTVRTYDNQNENYKDDSSTYRSDSENETNTNTIDRNLHAFGNIGITTTQAMLQADYEISKWNIYENIKDLFMQEFCIMIY